VACSPTWERSDAVTAAVVTTAAAALAAAAALLRQWRRGGGAHPPVLPALLAAVAVAAGLGLRASAAPGAPPTVPRVAAPPATAPRAAGYLAATVTLPVGAIGAAVAAFSGAPVEAIGPALALTGLLLLTSAPRLAVSAARVPVPPVPAPGDDVEAGDLEDIDHGLRPRSTDR